MNFINDTHEIGQKEMSFFLDFYNGLGRKIKRFIRYVEKIENNPQLLIRNTKVAI
jgi:hypothetical protein